MIFLGSTVAQTGASSTESTYGEYTFTGNG